MQSSAYWNLYNGEGFVMGGLPIHSFEGEFTRFLWTFCVKSLEAHKSSLLDCDINLCAVTPFYNALTHFSVNLTRKEPLVLEPHESDWCGIEEIVAVTLSMLLISDTTFVFTAFSPQLSTFLQFTMAILNWRIHQWGLLVVTIVILHELIETFAAASTSISDQATSITAVSTCSLMMTSFINYHASVNYIFGAQILALLICETIIICSTSENEGSCYFCKGLTDTGMKIDIPALVLFPLWHDLDGAIGSKLAGVLIGFILRKTCSRSDLFLTVPLYKVKATHEPYFFTICFSRDLFASGPLDPNFVGLSDPHSKSYHNHRYDISVAILEP
ncbi:hypothetical protein K7X08_028916 [Anisodus acutangulus]|uniref:Uncharacterized protein n=1 Tax=Anisodus acutangulus TaxID=402998 RepID=A0A9Q1L3B2_9SOLA|nr:hypothetical protein K7X08_028916 [Anisodus acutangulus]